MVKSKQAANFSLTVKIFKERLLPVLTVEACN
jgi:hypothetical protein